MGMVTINGQTYIGNNIQIVNNTVLIDGVPQDVGVNLSKVLEIKITEGYIEKLITDKSVSANSVGTIDARGSVNCGNVSGDINAGGSINCGHVMGNVTARGIC